VVSSWHQRSDFGFGFGWRGPVRRRGARRSGSCWSLESREVFSLLRFATSSIKVALIAIMTVAVLGGGVWFFDWYRDQTASANIGQQIVITIEEDDSVDDVAEKLTRYDLINFEMYFKGLLRIQSRNLEPGTYRLTVGMTTGEIVSAITSEESTAETERVELKVTIPEGFRIDQIADAVDEAGMNGGREAFLDALKDFDYSGYDFLDGMPNNNGRLYALEGFLYPDTYNFMSDDPPEYLIQSMLDNFESKVTPEMRDQAEAQGMSLYEVITLASIVEREAAIGTERPIIADVYLNRLEAGMRLEADPTVQYPLGKEGNWWPRLGRDDTANTDSPYNAYLNGGLPPGPISNPGLDSILAVLNPDDTNYLFFVAIGDSGEHVFAETYEEHEQNIIRYGG
jgi:UPF0755 protein